MRNASKFAFGATALAATTLVLTACGGGGGSSGGNGTLRMALTDAPACGFDEVNVTVKAVKVHKSESAAESDGGWQPIEVTPDKVNLLELNNGVLKELGQTQLPAGKYTQLRLVLASNSEIAMANSVKPTGGSETALDTPSAQQSGLKMNVNIDVEPGKVADFVLDFDACKSVVPRGNSGRYNLKPVLSILPRVTDAGLAVAGSVPAGASVSLQQQGSVVRATVATDSGSFVLSPVPAGNYDLVVNAEGRVTAVMTGVPVIRSERTTLAAINPPENMTVRSASGTVTTTGSNTPPDGAMVRALQTISTAGGGTKVELVGRPANAVSGAYNFQLPTGAPVHTAYSAGVTTWNFTSDPAAAGKYQLEAAASNKDPQVRSIDVTAQDAVEQNFTFAP